MRKDVEVTPLDEIHGRPIRMLNSWLPFACGLTLFTGHGETGKSSMALHLAALATRGELGDIGVSRVGLVLTEGGAANARGRLEAAGADMANVFLLRTRNGDSERDLDGVVDLNTRFDRLRQRCEENGIRMLILDSLAECMGSIDQNQHGPVSGIITRLNRWSEERGVEIIGIHHDGKANRPSRQAPIGASAFVDKSRVVISFVRDGEDGDCYLHVTKRNDVPGHPTFRFRLDGKDGEGTAFPIVTGLEERRDADWESIKAMCVERAAGALSPEDMSDAAGALASILNRHGGFMYSFDLKNEALRRYRMSPSAQGRARKKARIKGVRTSGFGCSHSVCTWEWTPKAEALAWAARHPIVDSPARSSPTSEKGNG